MTVSRLERLAAKKNFLGLRLLFSGQYPWTNGNRLSEKTGAHVSPTRTFGSGLCSSAGDLREIRDLAGGRADAGEQRQAIGANSLILIIDENMLKE